MSEVKFYLKGYNGQLSVYENKVVIERKGLLGALTNGLSGAKTIPMDSITTVQLKEASAMVNGYIQFGLLGSVERGGGVYDAVGDENAVIILRKSNDDARRIRDYIENIIMNRNKTQTTVIQQTSVADELKKFKELMDAGIISQEEFEAKKKELLNL